MRSFASLAQRAAHLRRTVATAPQAEHHAIDEASRHFLDAVRSTPGTYQAGWAELEATTQADRVAHGYSADDPLLRSGSLRDSYQRRVLDHRHAIVGSDDPRAPWFENGTRRMPPRPILGAAAAAHGKRIADGIGLHIHHHIAGRGL